MKKSLYYFLLYCIMIFSCVIIWQQLQAKDNKTVKTASPGITVVSQSSIQTVETESNRSAAGGEPEKKAKKKKGKRKQYSEEEIKILNRIVEAEAGGQDQKGKILVANVVLNRVKSNKYSHSIKKVVYAHDKYGYQFSPVLDGRIDTVHVSNDTKKAVNMAIKGKDYSHGAMYFMSRPNASEKNIHWFDTHLTFLFSHGGHEFFK